MYEMPKRFSQISSPEVVTQTDHIPVANNNPSNPGNIPYILSLKPISSLINPYRPFLVTSIQNNSTVEQSLMKGQGTSGNPIQLDDTYYKYVETATSANYVSDEALVKIGDQKQNLPITVSGFDLILSQDIPITTDKYVNKINAGTYALSSIGQRMQGSALVSAVFDVTNATFFLYAMFNPDNLANNYTLAIFDEPLTAPNHPQLAVVTIFLGVIITNGTTITSYPTKPFTQFGPYRLSEITSATLPLIYSIGWYNDSNGNFGVTHFMEGEGAYFIIKLISGTDNKNSYDIKIRQLLNGVLSTLEQTIVINNGIGSIRWDTADNGYHSPNGYVQIDNNQFLIDSLIGNPGKQVIVNGNNNVTIVDAGNTAPTYNVGFYSDSDGNNALSTIVEGSGFYLVIKTTNVPNGTMLYVTWNGTANQTDIYGNFETQVVVYNNKAWIYTEVKEDNIYESTETLYATISRDATIIGTTSTLNIQDMSYQVQFVDYGGNPMSFVNENSEFILRIVTTNVPVGRLLNLSYSGSANSSDFIDALPTSATVQNLPQPDGSMYTHLYINTRNDHSTEGNETFTVTLTDSYNNRTASNTLIINDSSTAPITVPDPTWSIGLYNDSAGSSPATSPLTPNTTKYVVIKTTDVSDGTAFRYWMDYTGANSTLHSGITITNNRYSDSTTITDGATALQLEAQTVSNATLALSPEYSITYVNPIMTIDFADYSPISTGVEWDEDRQNLRLFLTPDLAQMAVNKATSLGKDISYFTEIRIEIPLNTIIVGRGGSFPYSTSGLSYPRIIGRPWDTTALLFDDTIFNPLISSNPIFRVYNYGILVGAGGDGSVGPGTGSAGGDAINCVNFTKPLYILNAVTGIMGGGGGAGNSSSGGGGGGAAFGSGGTVGGSSALPGLVRLGAYGLPFGSGFDGGDVGNSSPIGQSPSFRSAGGLAINGTPTSFTNSGYVYTTVT